MDLVKSKKRVADHGEVFTPSWMVEAMTNLVKEESNRIDSRFLEPACGSGNFLVSILKAKLATVETKYSKSEFEKLPANQILLDNVINPPADSFDESLDDGKVVKVSNVNNVKDIKINNSPNRIIVNNNGGNNINFDNDSKLDDKTSLDKTKSQDTGQNSAQNSAKKIIIYNNNQDNQNKANLANNNKQNKDIDNKQKSTLILVNNQQDAGNNNKNNKIANNQEKSTIKPLNKDPKNKQNNKSLS